jgi:hypothetical protein
MRCRLSFLLFIAFFIFAILVAAAAAQSPSSQSTNSTELQNSVTIPGPLRSFLRMAGIRQRISPDEVLPILARNALLHGYQNKRATEYLILLRRYFHQATELGALAGADGKIRVNGCDQAEPLLRALGYRMKGECGHSEMSLVTADPQTAFLTIDSGFPLLDLEEALQKSSPFECPYAGSKVPTLFTASDWTAVTREREQQRNRDLVESLLYEPDLAQLYAALSRIDPETRAELKKDIGLENLLPLAAGLDLYGGQFYIRAGAVVVPGGQNAEKEWRGLVGANPKTPADFIPQLLKKDRGWLANYFDAIARADQKQQEHFAVGQRLKRYYEAFRSPGISSDAAASSVFRPASALMVLVTRLQWSADGNPYVPGSLQVWSEILRQKANAKVPREWGKKSQVWRHPDQLAEAMFAFSRLETETGPLQTYLCLSELDRRRPAVRRLSGPTVALMAEKFADFSNQYLLFSEFPELTDVSITRFLATAEDLSKISDHSLRANAMGTFQATVGLWQILARQGEIDRAHLDSSWQELIKPFSKFSASTQLLEAGRNSICQVFRAATGKACISQDEMISLLAGAHQRTAEGQNMQAEIANKMRSAMEDQELVSLDTLFALDDGLKDSAESTVRKETLLALAGELREFEMPRPIFTSGERERWAAGTYNNRHTEGQMRTNLAKVLGSPASLKQREEARGQLATFMRDTLVGMNYAYYEPPGSQVLHHNPLFVRSHDFSGDTVMGVEQLWQSAELFGSGMPAGGGAHLLRSLADLAYVLATTEQDLIVPDHVQALIWEQLVPGLISNAVVTRWWDVSQNELHAVALYQRAGEELLAASRGDAELRGKVLTVLSDRMFPARLAWLEQTIQSDRTSEMLEGIMPAETFYLTAEFRQRFANDLTTASAAGRELEALSHGNPGDVSRERLSRDFGIMHPVLAWSYSREFLNVKPFPALGGNNSRLMAESWDSGNLYWARLADEMGYPPVLLNRMVPELTRRMVERIFASDLEDWPAILTALRETGEEFRQGKISLTAVSTASTGKPMPETK